MAIPGNDGRLVKRTLLYADWLLAGRQAMREARSNCARPALQASRATLPRNCPTSAPRTSLYLPAGAIMNCQTSFNNCSARNRRFNAECVADNAICSGLSQHVRSLQGFPGISRFAQPLQLEFETEMETIENINRC
jgi:hypothetical protein